MTSDPRQTAVLRPSSIAVHDNRNVFWDSSFWIENEGRFLWCVFLLLWKKS
jgi:hypothetical protein